MAPALGITDPFHTPQILNAGRIETQRAGFLSFALAPASLDIAATQYALHHLNDFWKLVALQRIYGVLKPGGQLLLRDVSAKFARGVYATYIVQRLQWCLTSATYVFDLSGRSSVDFPAVLYFEGGAWTESSAGTS